MSEAKVWVRKRPRMNGKVSYDLRWICPQTHRWKSKAIGSDVKRAESERALLERQLAEGTYTDLRRVSWQDFVAEHVRLIPGAKNAVEAKHALHEFGKMFDNPALQRIRFGMVEDFVGAARERGNSRATVNKKLRYLRAAFNKAVRRGYVARNPMIGWQWTAEDVKVPRVATQDEEGGLLDAAERLYGFRVGAFAYAALNTGGRRGELLALTWDRVDLDGGSVLFTETKGHADRRVPINPELVDIFRRLQAQTLQAGGPFCGLGDNLGKKWKRIVQAAGVPHITLHDLRRSFATRLVRAGVAMPTVQQLLGHSKIETTRRYYVAVDERDKRMAVAKLRRSEAG